MVGCQPRNAFEYNLTDEERQLCGWVAEQARFGADRIRYAEIKAIMGIDDDQDITELLRRMRERCDDIHKIVHSPITHTNAPYFTFHRDADCIWDDYCRAEMEELGDGLLNDIEQLGHDELECLMCAV